MSRPSIVLIGCGKAKAKQPAPARDLYTGSLFRSRRAWVEADGRPWRIVSALHGLVRPGQVIEPYDLTVQDLADQPGWGDLVAAQLAAELVDPRANLAAELPPLGEQLAGLVVELHAGKGYRDPLVWSLELRGAQVVVPQVARLGMLSQRRRYRELRQELEAEASFAAAAARGELELAD